MKTTKIFSAAAALLIAGTLTAQNYLKFQSGNSSNAIQQLVQCTWDANANNPSSLFAKTSGFAIVNFNEATGAVSSGNGQALGSGALKMTTACMAHAGANSMVMMYDKTTIYYSLVNTNSSMPVFQYSFPRNVGPTMVGLYPVDIVYDGSQYFYVVLGGTYASSNTNTYAYGRIDGLNGNLSTFFINGTVSTPGIAINPTDIEYANNSIYIGGNYYTGSTTYYFIYKHNYSTTSISLQTLDYNTSTLTPRNLHLKASGTTIWAVGDFSNSSNSSSPLFLAKLTDLGTSFSLVNAERHPYSMNKITSVDLRSAYITVGSNNAINSAPVNFLYNTSTGLVMGVSSYSSVGGNTLARSIFSPASSRVFTVLRDNSLTGIYNFRTLTSSTQNYCYSSVSNQPVSITFPINSATYALKYENPVKTAVLSTGVGYTWTAQSQCLAAQNTDPDYTDNTVIRKSNAVVAPNPASDIVTVAAAEEKEISSVEIYSVTGQLLYTLQPENAATVTVSTSPLENGIYLFVIRNADGTVENKNVVVNH